MIVLLDMAKAKLRLRQLRDRGLATLAPSTSYPNTGYCNPASLYRSRCTVQKENGQILRDLTVSLLLPFVSAYETAFCKACEAGVGDNEVVEHGNADELPG